MEEEKQAIEKKAKPERTPEAQRKREIKLQGLKDKKKQGGPKSLPNIFSSRVTDKGDAEQVSEYLNAEMVRHCAYKRTKKGDQEPVVMAAIQKYEEAGEPIVSEENIS